MCGQKESYDTHLRPMRAVSKHALLGFSIRTLSLMFVVVGTMFQ
jgi:hypothetical protein